MEQTIHLGRFRGIQIGANWSLLLIAWLVVLALAVETLPTAAPGRATVAYWLTAAAAAAVFFASLVAHELAHATVARRHGVEVRRITLWLLGGIAQLESEATDASAELRIAAAGPLTSLAIGCATVAAALVVRLVPGLELTFAALVWIGGVNLLLGVFNLLPAFPLDGGRVLRAALWRASGDHLQATQRAGRIGVGFGYLFTAAGFLALLGGGVLDGLWLLLLGWFMLNAARAEVAAVTQDELLAGVTVAEVMSADPVTVPDDLPLVAFLDDYVLRHRHTAFPVVHDGHAIGLVTLDHVRRVGPRDREHTTVGEVATRRAELPTAAPGDELRGLASRLLASPVRRALVLDAGRLVGIVSVSDVAMALDARALRYAERSGPSTLSATPGPAVPSEAPHRSGRTPLPPTARSVPTRARRRPTRRALVANTSPGRSRREDER